MRSTTAAGAVAELRSLGRFTHMTFKVYVVDEDDNPVEGKRVHVSFTSFFRGWLEEFTGEDGHAVFDDERIDPGEAVIVVNDETHGPYDIDDGDGITIQI